MESYHCLALFLFLMGALHKRPWATQEIPFYFYRLTHTVPSLFAVSGSSVHLPGPICTDTSHPLTVSYKGQPLLWTLEEEYPGLLMTVNGKELLWEFNVCVTSEFS